ncbi:hypothetical protein ES705_32989 [subsurface metagenome]
MAIYTKEKSLNWYSIFVKLNKMKIKPFIIAMLLMTFSSVSAQKKEQPVLITLKDGTTLEANHFGQLQCGTGCSFFCALTDEKVINNIAIIAMIILLSGENLWMLLQK